MMVAKLPKQLEKSESISLRERFKLASCNLIDYRFEIAIRRTDVRMRRVWRIRGKRGTVTIDEIKSRPSELRRV